MASNCEPARSQRSSSASGSSDCNNAIAGAPSTRLSTPDRDTECTLVELFELYKTVETYLKEKGALVGVRAKLDAIVKLVRRVVMTPPTPSCAKEAIKALQSTVQKLANRIGPHLRLWARLRTGLAPRTQLWQVQEPRNDLSSYRHLNTNTY